MGPAPGMEPGISPPRSPSAPLSAQETNLGLNIDTPAQNRDGWRSLPCCARAVYQPSVENRDCRDFGLICSQLPGGEGRQRPQPGEGNSGQGCPDPPRSLGAWVWQDLGNNEVLAKPSCLGKVQLSSEGMRRPSLSLCRAVLLNTLQLKTNPDSAVLLSPLRSREESGPVDLFRWPPGARHPGVWSAGRPGSAGLPRSAPAATEGPRLAAAHEEASPRRGRPR